MSTYPNRPAPVEVLDKLRERGYTPNDRIRAFGTSEDAFDLIFDLSGVRVVTEEGQVTQIHLLDHSESPIWSVRTDGLTTRALEAMLEAAEAEAEAIES